MQIEEITGNLSTAGYNVATRGNRFRSNECSRRVDQTLGNVTGNPGTARQHFATTQGNHLRSNQGSVRVNCLGVMR